MRDAADRPLRVLEVETFGRGGLIHYAFNLSSALAERGHRVDLVTATDFELEALPRPPGLQVHTPVRRLSQRFGDGWPGPAAALGRKAEAVLDARTVARVARQLEPDVIHLHNTNASALAYLAALRRLRIPIVATTHQVTPHEPMAFQDTVYRRIHGWPDLLIAHSEVDRKRLRDEFGITGDRVAVIPHGDYGFFSDVAAPPDRASARARFGLAEDAPVALFFGYIREYKGLDLLLDAWPAVAERVPGARLLVAGDPVRLAPDRREALERQAEALGVVHRFDYIPMEDVSAWFAAADLLVLPYRHISQSGVLYLALALGVPVVATAVGAWPEMLDDGDSALLVEPESTEALVAAVARALGDPDLRARLAAGGRRVAEAHAWPAVAAKTESAFRDLLGRRAARQLQ